MTRGASYRINGGYMKRRFALVCKAMGWDCTSPAWQGEGEARGPADAGAGAGDDGDLTLQTHALLLNTGRW